MPKPIICLLAGGQSSEHEVSLISAANVAAAISREKYDVLTIAIDKEGTWHWFADGKFAEDTNDPCRVHVAPGGVVVFPMRLDGRAVLAAPDGSQAPMPFDVMFPVLHGKNGEDGTVQGLAELLGCPCVGCRMTSSAICMDKGFTKQILEHEGILTAPWMQVQHGEAFPATSEVVARLGLPLFVKPANAGSSVGVIKVKRAEDLEPALREAFQYDYKVLLEKAMVGREIECAVMGNDSPFCPTPGEIIPKAEFYSYEAKYIMEDGAVVVAPTRLEPEAEARVRELAVRIYRILGCRGFARIDFFLLSDGTFVLNELNTIPGFTQISMYPKLMIAAGISYPEIVDRLIQLSLE